MLRRVRANYSLLKFNNGDKVSSCSRDIYLPDILCFTAIGNMCTTLFEKAGTADALRDRLWFGLSANSVDSKIRITDKAILFRIVNQQVYVAYFVFRKIFRNGIMDGFICILPVIVGVQRIAEGLDDFHLMNNRLKTKFVFFRSVISLVIMYSRMLPSVCV